MFRHITTETPLTGDELSRLNSEGWDFVTVVPWGVLLYYYFKKRSGK